MKLPSIEKLRAWWSHRQGLDGRLDGANSGEVLAKTGWARSVGGVGPYLTLHARAGTSREAVDASVVRLEIHELPAARGCTYVVPAADFALALKAGESFEGAEMKTASKLGVTEKEVAKLCDTVLKALEKGKKKGLTTTLPLALGKLQARGDIRRVPVNGRVDQQRYRYTLWRPNPREQFNMSSEEVQTELARRYFSWAGPAAIAEFQWFSALSGKAAKAAIEPLKIESLDGDRFMLPGDREKFEAFQVPKQAHYTLVSSIDGISLLRRDLPSLADGPDLKKLVTGAGPKIVDLPSHAIFDRGRLVGIWEYDPEKESIAWLPFIAKNKDLEKAVARTEDYVRAQLGDARSFSLDSPKSRAPKIALLRQAAAR
jgi:hypothetical protein